jgi:hypothetical protein
MEQQKKSAMVGIPVIIFALSAILLSASPCAALEVPGETTLNVDYPIGESVTVKAGGTLNLLDGGSITGVLYGIGVEDDGTLNIYGGYISKDVYAANGSEVNIKGGSIGGNGYNNGWDIAIDVGAKVTVFGTDFNVTNGTIDSSGTYFTPDVWPPSCELEGKYGGEAGDIYLRICAFDEVQIFLAPPASDVMEVLIDIKPGSEQNTINLKSKGVVPVAVLTTDDFDATTIDTDTVQFAGAAPERWSFEDVDNDGDDDIIFHFRTQGLALDQNSTEATLTADLLTGDEEVSGTDQVRIVPSKK